VPDSWRAAVAQQLDKDEQLIAAVEMDLDSRLQFVRGILLVTNQRLLACAPGTNTWSSWKFAAGLRLTHHDHAGVGHVELFDEHSRLASWRFTLGQNLHMIRLLDHFKEQSQSALTGQPIVHSDQNICPSCKAILEPEEDECPVCTKVLYTPPRLGLYLDFGVLPDHIVCNLPLALL